MTQEIYTAHYRSPIGLLEVMGTEKGIRSVQFVEEDATADDPHPCLQECIEQLDAYFQGEKDALHSLRLAMVGTDFKLDVWEETICVPYGETVSYRDIAKNLGKPKAARAVGSALNANPLLILVPCHRVVSSSKESGGYAGGIERKEWLLEHEKKNA